MSDGPRYPLATAIKAADWLATKLGLAVNDQGHPQVVGSVRRGEPEVGDLEIIAAMPFGDTDPLLDAIKANFSDPKAEPVATGLFGGEAPAQPTKPIGEIVQGAKPGFRACRLLVKGKAGPLKVEIYRYDHGPAGNRGIIQLIRTGPREFGQAILAAWAETRRGPADLPAMRDGYLIDIDGKPVPTPDEESVFRLVNRPFVPAANRGGRTPSQPASASPARRTVTTDAEVDAALEAAGLGVWRDI